MRGEAERILYIGQSKNLRTRLAFYKNANPDRIPRRLTRLVHQIHTITLERCPSPDAARARELELLRLHRPKFNRADTGPQFFHYVEWQSDATNMDIRIHFDPPTNPEHERSWHGPVRGRMIPAQGLAALQRLAISAERQLRRCEELPLVPRRLTCARFPHHPHTESFLRGESIDLVTDLLARQAPDAELPLRQLHECDAETLLSWWRLLQDV